MVRHLSLWLSTCNINGLFSSALSPVVNLTVSFNSTHITVMWQEPAEPNGILQYNVSITGEVSITGAVMMI